MRVIHYTEDKKFNLMPIGIRNFKLPIKPYGGLWCSPIGSRFGWMEWCKAENFRQGRYRKPILFEIDELNMLKIDTYKDIAKLPWTKHPAVIESGIDEDLLPCIDFEQLVKDGIDSIYLTLSGERETRFTYPKNLYGWDCETVLILNEKCIKKVVKNGLSKITEKS